MFDELEWREAVAERPRRYRSAMTVSAHDVAAAIRQRLPGVPVKKLHKLLYYCQGHHVAAFGEPLFDESVMAWDMGPVVGKLWYAEKNGQPAPEPTVLDEGQLNTVGLVLSRYGGLTGADLEVLTHAEDPWRRADAGRPPGQSERIEIEWLHSFFGSQATEDEEVVLDAATVSMWLGGAHDRREDTSEPLDRAELLRRLGSRA